MPRVSIDIAVDEVSMQKKRTKSPDKACLAAPPEQYHRGTALLYIAVTSPKNYRGRNYLARQAMHNRLESIRSV